MPRLTIDAGGPARVEVRDAEDRLHQPAGALTDTRASDRPGVVDMDRSAQDASGALPFYGGHFVTAGTDSLDLAPGSYLVVVEKGTEFDRLETVVDLATDRHLTAAPGRWADMAARGWWSADLHVHRPVEDARLLLLAEGLDLGVFITMWNGQDADDHGQPAGPPQVGGSPVATVMNAEDERGGGAWMLHGVRRPPARPDDTWWYPPGRGRVADATAAGAWFDCEKLLWWEVPVMMATTRVDSVGVLNNHYVQYGMMANEAWGRPRDRARFPGRRGFSDYLLGLYYRYLNCSFRLPASAGSASGVLPAPPGYNRVYVSLREPFSVPAFYRGLRAGRSFVSNGPMLSFTADGAAPGDTLVLPGGRPVRLAAVAQSRASVERVEVLANGRVIAESSGDRLEAEADVDGTTWLAARCYEGCDTTVRLAHSSPIYLSGPRQRWDRSQDATYFVEWIDDLLTQTAVDPARFATEEDRAEVVRLYESARAVYAAM